MSAPALVRRAAPAAFAPPRSPRRAPRRRLGWAIAAVAVCLDVAVCVPFVYDPLGWREPPLAAPGSTGRAEYVLFLAAGADAPARTRFFAAHPQLRVEHQGGWAGTLVVSVPAGASELVAALRAQPFVRLVSSAGAIFCRSS